MARDSFPTDDNDDDLSGPELQALESELPSLARIRRFATAATRVDWFAHVGEHPGPFTMDMAEHYADALGFPDARVALVTDWAEAAAAAETLDFDSASWEAEEQLRSALTMDALAVLSEDALSVALTHVAATIHAPIRTSVEEALAIWDEPTDEMLDLAVGSAVQACHQAALVLAAGAEEDHPFALRFRLFEGGRWPIGVAGLSFNLF
ncbi:hypothetical protein [Pyruvatibacter sp.]|uniref:hypothetical protein n=1 Tax=Pyruvatibacter sp. TaxID=1981328 RepID=UPI0032EFF8F6